MEIEIVRGTSNTFKVSLTYPGGIAYTPKTGDMAVFGVKHQTNDKTLLIVKRAPVKTDGSAEILLDPEDTECLCCGKYVYDVSLESGEDFINAIKESPFRILSNVTFRGCDK